MFRRKEVLRLPLAPAMLYFQVVAISSFWDVAFLDSDTS